MRVQGSVGICNGLFIFKITHITDAPENILGINLFTEIHSEALVNGCRNLVLIFKDLIDP
jgi:hypothetical protein